MNFKTTLSPIQIDRFEETRSNLKRVLTMIRDRDSEVSFNPGQALSSDIRIGHLNGRPVERLVITLRSTGCGWVRRGGGCTMCGHYPGTSRGVPLSSRDPVAQFGREMERYRSRRVPVLCLYNSGSILNQEELSQEALSGILAQISTRQEIKKVVLESRPEYCSEEKIQWIRKRLGSKTLEVAMGLESSDDTVLSLALNKGFLAEEFRRMVERIGQYVRIRIYVMLKGPFLTESEAIEDAVAAVRFAGRLSPSEIHLEPATLQGQTLLYYLHQTGLYRLPWLWSVYEVLRRAGEETRVYVSPFNHMPRPLSIPENCGACTEGVRELLIRHYNLTFDLGPLHRYACACRERWEEALGKEDPRPLDVRVREGLRAVEDLLLRQSMEKRR